MSTASRRSSLQGKENDLIQWLGQFHDLNYNIFHQKWVPTSDLFDIYSHCNIESTSNERYNTQRSFVKKLLALSETDKVDLLFRRFDRSKQYYCLFLQQQKHSPLRILGDGDSTNYPILRLVNNATVQRPFIKQNKYQYIDERPVAAQRQRVSSNNSDTERRFSTTTANSSQSMSSESSTTRTASTSIVEHQIEQQVAMASNLDLSVLPRLSRDKKNYVVLHDRKQAGAMERQLILLTLFSWGYFENKKSNAEKVQMAKDCCNLISYDFGFKTRITGHTQIDTWMKNFRSYLDSGNVMTMSPSHVGTQKYVDAIEIKYPGYITSLWRYAITTAGPKATYGELTDIMNDKSMRDTLKATLSLHELQVFRWFQSHNGKEISPIEKPLDTKKHCSDRLTWVQVNYPLLTDVHSAVAFLDEKWFYTTNRRSKLKYLPLQEGEEVGADKISRPKMRNRRYPVKAMFMGVVGRPRPDLQSKFDGRIHLERISETVQVKTETCHQNFSDDVHINSLLKSGKWKDCIDSSDTTLTAGEMLDIVATYYDLDGKIADGLEIQYKSFRIPKKKEGQSNTNKKHSKIVRIQENDCVFVNKKYKIVQADLTLRFVTIEDLKLVCRRKKGQTYERDISCDSAYMMKAMRRVGKAIRSKFTWVKSDKPCYLVMDQAGGHGSQKSIQEYTDMLKDEWNVIVVFQPPRSPYFNVLDLGFWCSLQSLVQKRMYGNRGVVDTLVKTVYESWETQDMTHILGNIFNRLKKVMALIVDGNGSNDLVETKRGKKFRVLDLWMPPSGYFLKVKQMKLEAGSSLCRVNELAQEDRDASLKVNINSMNDNDNLDGDILVDDD